MDRTTPQLVAKAYELFDAFYQGTEGFRSRCRSNEALWRGTHWREEAIREGEPQPVTPVLFSTVENILGDLADSYPEAVLRGEGPEDDEAAARLTRAVDALLTRMDYQATYVMKCRSVLKFGLAVQQVVWDPSKLNGLGDIAVTAIPVRNFLYDPEVDDFQLGRACFTFGFYTPEWLEQEYGDLARDMQPDRYRPPQDDDGATGRDDRKLRMVMEYWYRDRDGVTGLPRVHMARIGGGVLLYDSREDFPDGLYRHGRYPFIVEALYPLEGEVPGLGICDLMGDLQRYTDKLDQIILKNALMSSKLKLLINRSADLDVDAMRDWSREVVEAGRIDDAAVRWFQAAPLSPYLLNHQQTKVNAIKEESGQNQFSRGEAGKGVTAASAIMALQEASSKRSRVINAMMYEGFRSMVDLVLSLMAEFYTEGRTFRGQDGGVIPVQSTDLMRGVAQDARLIDFDISVHAQKNSPFATAYQNDLAFQLLSNGVITPDVALSMLDFTGKDQVVALMANRAMGAPQ